MSGDAHAGVGAAGADPCAECRSRPGWRGREATSAMYSATSSCARWSSARPVSAVATLASPVTPDSVSPLQCGM